MWQYLKVSSEARSQISSEITPKVARTTAHNASSATFEEVRKTSRIAHAARASISQETHRASASAHDQNDGEDQFCRLSPLQTLQFKVAEGSLQPCDSTGILNIDEGIAHVNNKSKILQKSSILQIQNERFTPASLSGNARSASNARPVFCLPQNARPVFCQLHNTMSASLVLNARLAF